MLNLNERQDKEVRNISGKVLFLFPGNGIHQRNMLNILSKVNSFLKDTIADIAEISEKMYPISLLEETIENQTVNQLRTFASELAICRFWEKAGCVPDYLIGHSLGEYAAACYAGVFNINDCIRMLMVRSKILEKTSDLLMMCAVNTTSADVLRIAEEIDVKVDIAAYNAKKRITIVGQKEDIKQFCNYLKEKNIEFHPIQVSGGSHCSRLEPYREYFMDEISSVEFNQPQKTIISTVHPTHNVHSISSPEYWFEHMVNPVHFMQAIRAVSWDELHYVVDLGVSPSLLGMAMNNVIKPGIIWVPTVRAGQNYRKQIGEAAEIMCSNGIQIDKSMFESS